MELRSIRKKGENIQVIGEITALYKYDGVSLTTEIIPAFNGVSSIVNYDEDVYLFVEQGKYFDVIRIGKPPAMMVIKDTESKRFNQYDTIGNLTGFIDSVEIGQNYWKVVPLVIGRGYFELDGYKQPFDFGYDVNEQPVNTEGGIGGECSPVLKLQSNVWQLVAIPVKDAKVYEDVLLKLQNQTGVAIEELVTLCTTYYGDENKYRAFAVGVTNPLSDNNFPLTYNDGGTGEVTAFWIRTKDFTAVGLPDTIVLEW